MNRLGIFASALATLTLLPCCGGGNKSPEDGGDGGGQCGAACGHADAGVPNDAGDAGAWCSTCGPADGRAGDSLPNLVIVTPFGVSLIHEHLIDVETPVEGTISVMRGGADVTDAVVTLNGTVLPYSNEAFPGYDTSAVDDLAPGDEMTIEATTSDPPQFASVSVTCPALFEITSPADGSAVVGAPLTVTWSPPVAVKPTFTFVPAPVAGQYTCETSDGTFSRLGTGDGFVPLDVGQSSVTLTDVDGNCDLSIIEVRTSSELGTDGSGGSALCYLHRRVQLKR